MENHNKLVSWLFSILVGIVSFFLFMFYQKVDSIGIKVTDILIESKGKEEQLRSIENRLRYLEKAVLESNNQNK